MKWLPLLLALCPLTPAFADLNAEIKTASEQKELAVAGVDSWLFLKQEFVHLAKGPLTAENAAPALKAITAYHTALAAAGVQLIVLPVPAKAEIYPDKFSSTAAPDALAGRLEGFFKALKDAGVTAIDLTKAFQERRLQQAEPTLYCARDAHWSPIGVQVATDLVIAQIKDRGWFKPALPLAPARELSITGDLMTTPATEALGPEKVRIQPTAALLPTASDAPAILLGDSHTLVFSDGAANGFHCQGAGLPDLLQAASGQPWMQVANAGGGTDAARMQLTRKAVARADFWKGKQVLVWCFSIREVTEKKWAELPIKK